MTMENGYGLSFVPLPPKKPPSPLASLPTEKTQERVVY